jgi:hypothetical protein
MLQLFRRSRLLLTLAVCWGLAACETMPEVLVTTGTGGIKIQAERLVTQVYAEADAPLPYGGPDIDNPLASMKLRWPRLKPLLENGTLGFTEDGDVAIRDFGGRDKAEAKALRALVRAENNDRQLLYRAMTSAGGYSMVTGPGMLDYTEDVFAEQWATQAPMGWWIQDHCGQWFRK